MRQVIWFVTLICAWHPLSGFPAGAVATVDSIATDAAIATMKQGGNAIDAAVAAGLTLGVVNGYNSALAAWPVASSDSMELPAAISVPLIKSRLVISLISLFRALQAHKQLSILR